MRLLREKRTILCCMALVAYIIVLFYLGVWNRGPFPTNSIKLELFWGYNNPPKHIIRDNFLNIASFIPIGLLTGLIFTRNRALNAFLVGMFVSVVIECSQHIWSRGTCDIDDVFNNAVGALLGGALVVLVTFIKNRTKKK